MRDDVGAYIDAAPADRQPALERLRRMCLELLRSFAEEMRYGMPGYVRDGAVEVGFANRKGFIAVYVLRTEVMAAHRDQLEGLDVGKGVIRYRRPERIDWATVGSMLISTADSDGPVC